MKTLMVLASLFLLALCSGNSESAEEPGDTGTPADTAETAEIDTEADIEPGTLVTVEDYGRITDRELLVSRFGEENLAHGESWYAEGTVRFDHTVLTDPENGQVITYVWGEDDSTLGHIEAGYYIFDRDYTITGTQTVLSDCGVSTGMSLAELREWNGADFEFLGFGWDYEGGIIEEEGSRLAECPVEIKLSFDLETEIPEEYTGMYGDRMFSTADEIAQGAPILVDRLTYHPTEER